MIQFQKLTMQKYNLFPIFRSALSFAALLCVVTACGKTEPEKKDVADQAPAAPVVEEAPTESLNDIMKRLDIDKRIRVEDGDKAPTNTQQAEAVLVFFNAMVRGDTAQLSPLMSAPDQAVLAEMVQTGEWKSTTENIARVNVGWTAGTTPDTLSVLGFFLVGDDFAAQLWTLSSSEDGKKNLMTALPSPPKMAEKLQGDKTEARIKQWLSLNKEELAFAKANDEVIEIPQQFRSVKGESVSEDGSGKSSPGSPEAPGRKTTPAGPKVPHR